MLLQAFTFYLKWFFALLAYLYRLLFCIFIEIVYCVDWHRKCGCFSLFTIRCRRIKSITNVDIVYRSKLISHNVLFIAAENETKTNIETYIATWKRNYVKLSDDIEKWFYKLRLEHSLYRRWALIFDHVDVIFLIIFQTINTVVTVLLLRTQTYTNMSIVETPPNITRFYWNKIRF
jgi:hypothetical protein